jgi:hypothetical protein
MILLLANRSPSGTALQFHEFNELRTFCTRVLHKLCQAVTFEENGSTLEKCYVLPAKHVHPYGYVTFLQRRTVFKILAVLPLVIFRRA